MTTIRYFIPEDGDIEEQPNVFLAPKARQQGYAPSLVQIKEAFPLPGRYYFRFKSPLVPGADREKGAMPVWMDIADDRQPVPVWRNTIVAKVTRIGVDEDDDDDDDEDFERHAVPASQPTPSAVPNAGNRTNSSTMSNGMANGGAPPQAAAAHHQPSYDIFDTQPRSAPASAHSSGGNLFDNGMPTQQQQQIHMNGAMADMLGMGGAPAGYPPSQQPKQQHVEQHDFFGMGSVPPPAPMSGNSVQSFGSQSGYGGQQQHSFF